jgi:hypothetical protein
MHWWFPCSSTPSAGGHYDTMTVGRPPDNLVAYIVEHDPDNPANEARIAGGVLNGDEFTHVETDGCAAAGGNGIFRATAVRPWANVGTEAQPLKFAITRTVVPGPAPDLVTVTYVSGTFQTFTAGASDQARATLKLIVYPDQSTADADAGLDGVGSAFYGAATLLGGSGDLLPSQGLSLGDFTIVGDGTGLFTATPILGFSKVVAVPDANAAAVSMVADPKVSDGPGTSTTSVPGSSLTANAWLAPASPNPTRGSTRIRFAIPREGHVRLAIYDQQGRHVRQLVDGTLRGGEHETRWDGLDGSGNRVPSAMYFYRLETDGQLLIGKVLAIR